MWYAAKTILYITFEYMIIPGLKPFVDFQAGQPCGPEGPEAKRTFIKIGLEDGFQYQFHGSLDYFVLHCQDAQLSLASVIFRDMNGPDHICQVLVFLQISLY